MMPPALVLAAGLGTRLRPLTDVRAKPAIPVAGEPMIRRIAAWLASHGVTDLVVNLHHKPETIAAVTGDGSDLDVRVRYSWEQPVVLGSGGGPRQALAILGARTFLIVNGDTLTDLDVAAIVREHHESGARVTLGVVPNAEYERYGGVLVDDPERSRRVTGFVARGPGARASWHFVGVQVVDAAVFDRLTPGVPASSIGGLYDDLVRENPGSVRAFCTTSRFFDVGTPADYWRTSVAFAPSSDLDRSVCGRRASVDPSARVTRSILWDDVRVERGAVVDRCIVTDRVSIASASEYRDSILVAAPDGAVAASPLII